MDDTTQHRTISVPDALPVLPLRDTVIFPMAVAPILVGQERSVTLVSDAISASRLVALVAQRNVERWPAQPEDLYSVGTMALIHELSRAQGNTIRIAVQGIERIRTRDYVRSDPYLVDQGVEIEALTRTVRDLFIRIVGLVAELPDELAIAAQALDDPRAVSYLVASSAPLPAAVRQEILEADPVSKKLRRLPRAA